MNAGFGLASLLATLALCGLTLFCAPGDRSNLLTRVVSGDRLVERAASQEWAILGALRGSFFHHPNLEVDDAPQGRAEMQPWMTHRRDHLVAKCQKMQPIMDCHRKCGRDHECHTRCLLPECPRAKAQIEEVMQCHGQCGDDSLCHRDCPRPFFHLYEECRAVACHEECGKEGDAGCHEACRRSEHHGRWPGMEDIEAAVDRKFMQLVDASKLCRSQCFDNVACLDRCPKPEAMVKEQCDSLHPIIQCHLDCGSNGFACHQQCPLPKCDMMKKKVEESLECHGECGDRPWCHHRCPAPLAWIREKCSLGAQREACHQACSHCDSACHHACELAPVGQNEGGDFGDEDDAEVEDDEDDRHHHGHHHGDGEHHEHHHHDHGMHGWEHHGHHHGHHHEDDEHHEHHHHDDEHSHHMDGWEHHGHHGHHHEEETHHEEDDPMKQRWHQEMMQRVECESHCTDEACVSKCPKPWMNVIEKCSQVMTVAKCHRSCGHKVECHFGCPLPACPKMALRMEQSMQCHRQCLHDRDCHRECPKPLHDVRARCETADFIHGCHAACLPGDRACHQACPKLFEF